MRTTLHHAMHWMHDETATVGHWCNMHMVHDYHFWLYLLIAAVLIAFIVLMISMGGGVTGIDSRFYAYPYTTL